MKPAYKETHPMGATEKLAHFAVDFPTEMIPDSILHLGKRCFINFSAVALYASKDPSVEILLNLFREEGGVPRASVIGRMLRTSLQNAAMVNGYLAHHLDYDDTHYLNMIHASSPIFPAALSVGEDRGASGREFLAAYVLGIEVASRIGSVIAPAYREAASFWHITSTCGVFGAAAAAGRLLKLTPEAMTYALGIAGTQASGLRQVFGSMCKAFHTGHAAKSGVLAALLAHGGFTSNNAILEGKRGFVSAMAKNFDLDKATADLGERWELPMVGLKPYACGVGKHGLIDAVLALRSRERVSLGNVESLHGSIRVFKSLDTPRHPTTGAEASFSYHHAMAVALVDGAAYPAQYSDERVKDPILTSLRDRITIAADPSLGSGAAVAVATLKDGGSYREQVDHPTGSPERPMTDSQVEAKFRALASEVLPQEGMERLLENLWNLDEVADTRTPAKLLRNND